MSYQENLAKCFWAVEEIYKDSTYWEFKQEDDDDEKGIYCDGDDIILLPGEDAITMITYTLEGPSEYTLRTKEEVKKRMIFYYTKEYFEVNERTRESYPKFLTKQAFREIKRRLKIK